ncbi:hypothetical protein F2Q69_00022494 [Brassica cretica]|uniref:Uncharacterized protein n=1 Tax=Brassica cretica TaxID=69181 RepID=A0A8S9QCI1_BRACR|nr:hypothetical protein F2Q69_00022494 [Brassica cretica]
MKVKGIRKLRLNQNMRETRAGILAHSAGNSWWSAHLSWEECSGPNQCGRVRAVTDRAGCPCVTVGSQVLGIEPGSEKGQVSFEKEGKRRITAMSSYWAAVMGKTALLFVGEIKRMDTRQKDKEKEIEKEKETAPGDHMEAQILGLGRIKELMKVHGFGRTDHDQDPYVLGTDLDRGKGKAP